MPKQFSLEQIRSVFANTSVKVVVYVPPRADPKSLRVDDVYAWLNGDQMPGSMIENIIWVCDSTEQVLASTNMGNVYGGPLGWVPGSQTEVETMP